MQSKSNKPKTEIKASALAKWNEALEAKAEAILDEAKVSKGIVSIKLSAMYAQIGSSQTISYVKRAIEKMLEMDFDKFVLTTDDMYVSDSAFEALVKMYNDFSSNPNIQIKFKTSPSNFKLYSDNFGKDFGRFEVVQPKVEKTGFVETKPATAKVVTGPVPDNKMSKADTIKQAMQNIESIRAAGEAKQPEIDPNLPPAERKRLKAIYGIMDTKTTANGIHAFRIASKYESLTNNMTAAYIIEAVKELGKKDIVRAIIDLRGVDVSEPCVETFKNKLAEVDDIKVKFLVNDVERPTFIKYFGEGFDTFAKVRKVYDIETLPVVSAHDIIKVDSISINNNGPWLKIIDYMKEHREPTNFDFKGINIQSPLASDTFRKLLGLDNFYMTIYYDSNLARNLSSACALNGSPNKVKHIEATVVHQPTKAEIMARKAADSLKEDYTATVGDKKIIYVGNKYSQLGNGSTTTADALRLIIEDIRANEPNIKEVELNFGNINIEGSAIGSIVSVVKDMSDDKLDVVYVSNNEDIEKSLDIERVVGNSNMEPAEKLKLVRENIKKYTAGFLAIFEVTRSKDRYGRSGNGKAVRSRPAIYKGAELSGDDVIVHFDVYAPSTFTTATDYSSKHDGAELKLNVQDSAYNINEIGFGNMFFGEKGHFTRISQSSIKENVKMTVANSETGNTAVKEFTIPERFKAVFDSFGIKYDEESLESDIKRINEQLGIFQA